MRNTKIKGEMNLNLNLNFSSSSSRKCENYEKWGTEASLNVIVKEFIRKIFL